jgi:hypothetical protein
MDIIGGMDRRVSHELIPPSSFAAPEFCFQWLQVQPIALNLSFIANPEIRCVNRVDAFPLNPFRVCICITTYRYLR